jgi:protein involved in polysaccharide export with SLBB domain
MLRPVVRKQVRFQGERTAGTLLIPSHVRFWASGCPSTFSPVQGMQVASDYIMGPGDELESRIWGQVEANLRVTQTGTNKGERESTYK